MECGDESTCCRTKRDYLDIRTRVRMATHTALDGDLNRTWASVSLEAKQMVTSAALSQYPYLHRFPNNWAAVEMMRRLLRNKRDTIQNKQDRKKGTKNTGKH
ncbi:hypothetical protein CTheo_9224 [Ceratobasidium theobromae]|uniref:Uncharacterized protein n=1 Tax=Ceratobasidium theobromae TaxID=1582974 RepID=A0A5N5Q7B3_9AGAM|nr:hypothetical protein CTheo_9224 [Ceratobasidium theobromae]